MSPLNPLSKHAAALLAQFPGPVTLHSSKSWRHLLAFIALYFGSLIGLLGPHLAHLSGEALLVLGMVAVVPAPLVIWVGATTLRSGPQRMTLDDDGFEAHSGWGVHRTRWSDVTRFRLLLLLVFHDDAKPPRGRWDRLNRTRLWNDTFGLGAKNFARLMTEWRERALAARTQ
jgi:hypothetical protein